MIRARCSQSQIWSELDVVRARCSQSQIWSELDVARNDQK